MPFIKWHMKLFNSSHRREQKLRLSFPTWISSCFFRSAWPHDVETVAVLCCVLVLNKPEGVKMLTAHFLLQETGGDPYINNTKSIFHVLTKCFSSGPYKSHLKMLYLLYHDNGASFPFCTENVLKEREGGKVGVSTSFPSLLGSPQHVHFGCKSLLFKKQNRFIFWI